jgi:hypothetical protein
MIDLHAGHYGGHFAACTTAHNILREEYYWPIIFFHTHRYVRSCQPCHFFTGKQCLPFVPLKPIIMEAPFQQWGLDFIVEFKDNSSNKYRWILTTIDYFTRWVKAIPTKKETEEVVMRFLEENIITRFGVPNKITTDNFKYFSSMELNDFLFKYGILLFTLFKLVSSSQWVGIIQQKKDYEHCEKDHWRKQVKLGQKN